MIGSQFGHYRILEKLGEGGMGVIYRARDETLQREIALKLLPAETSEDASARARLLREARMASALNHPNICTVHEVGEAQGRVYIAMELVRGESLAARLDAGPLPLESTLQLGAQIASALAEAHAHGVIHRDLKSANVVLTPRGEAKVLDFGLARRTSSAQSSPTGETLTESGAIVGTPQYLAPEVLRGDPPDSRSDIWSLGVVLHEMAAGERPFEGRTWFETSAAILNDAPRPLPSGVPAELRDVVLGCLEKYPAQRTQRAGDVAAALATLASGGSPPARGVRARSWAGALAAAGLLIGAALYFANPGGWRARLLRPPAGGRIQALAVLPLENLSGDPEQEYFAEGMTDELITDLSKVGSLSVIARGSVMRFARSPRPLREIARELHVDLVVQGSVLKAGERVRINAQLVRPASGRNLWADGFERELKDVLALQSDVAQAVAREIQAKLTPGERVRLQAAGPVNPMAYDLYLRGRHALDELNEESDRRALQYFQRAVELDPNYAAAYAWLAECYVRLSEIMPFHEAMSLAKTAALKATELDSSLAEAHAALGLVRMEWDWDWLGAEREFKHAIELNPSYARAHTWDAFFLRMTGRYERDREEISIARRLDPLDRFTSAQPGWTEYFGRHYGNARRMFEEVLRADSANPNATAGLGMSLEQQGDYARAIITLKSANALYPNVPEFQAALGHALAVAGRVAEARAVLDTLLKPAAGEPIGGFEVAIVYLGLGDKEKAIFWLQRAVADRRGWVEQIKVDPRLDPLRSEPRFGALLKRMGLAS